MKNNQAVNLFGWVLAGALLAIAGRFGYTTFVIINQGGTLAGAPVIPLLLEVMELHRYAGYGALGGFGFGLIERFWWFLRNRVGGKKPQPLHDPLEDTDTLIRTIRSKRADEYLHARAQTHPPIGEQLEPPIENIITAREGTLTYRVMAYRALSQQEMMGLVRQGLDDGSIREPATGGVTSVITTLGHAC